MMNEQQIRQLFKNTSDCYADTWSQDGIGAPMVEGEVIQAMTEEAFVKAIAALRQTEGEAVDVDKLADEYANGFMDGRDAFYGFRDGFNKAVSMFKKNNP